MKTHPLSANAATLFAVIMISSSLPPLLSRSSRGIAALAFRPAQTTHVARRPQVATSHLPSACASTISCRSTPRLCHASEGEGDAGTADTLDHTAASTPDEHYARNNPGAGWAGYKHPRFGGYLDNLKEDNGGNEEEAGGGTETGVQAAMGDDTQQTETWQNPRSRWARKKHRKKMEAELREQISNGDSDGSDMESGGLDWETFDFSMNPKNDKRFKDSDGASSPSDRTGIPDHVLNTISTDSITYKTYLQSEADIDKATSSQSRRSQSELLSLSPELVQKAIDVLSPYVQPRRLERIDEVLGQRTRHTRFLYENPSNPSNVFASLRTLDSFGIQYVDTIVDSESYQGKAAVNQKRGMRTAMGSAVWMTLQQFGSLEEAVTYLREEEGCLIYASDLNPSAKDVRDLTWDVDFDDEDTANDGVSGEGREQRPICIVMGNEDRGISDEMRALADETFYLPMCGFAESFNLSVATSITLAYMSAVSGRAGAGEGSGEGIKGPLRPGDLDPHELQCLKLKGVLNSLAQKRVGKVLLKKEGIVLPKSLLP